MVAATIGDTVTNALPLALLAAALGLNLGSAVSCLAFHEVRFVVRAVVVSLSAGYHRRRPQVRRGEQGNRRSHEGLIWSGYGNLTVAPDEREF